MRILFLLLLSISISAFAETTIVVKGLYKDGAIVTINGKQRVLKKGRATPEGVELVSATTKQARIRVDGEVKTMTLSRRIGAKYDAPERATVRIAAGRGGHHWATGFINGSPTTFVVDTGATSIAMSSRDANSLGIDYKKGQRIKVNTANGLADAFMISLNEVTISTITLYNVQASVIEGAFPTNILLGNSFLGQVNMKTVDGVLILEAKY